jgi:hypothetical protein
MTKINNYIRYLLTLILLGSINVFAQTSNGLSQVISQAQQEASNLLPSSTSSINTASFAEIIKQNMDKFGYYFINYALPFLFVFGILIYLTGEAKKEVSKPLLLIYFIFAFLATIFFHDILNIIALVFTLILVIVGIHKIFHGITGSIIGFLVAIAILIGVLTNDSFRGFLSSTAYFIFLFVLFIIIFILGIRAHREISQYTKEIEKSFDSLYRIITGSKKSQEIQKELEEIRNKAKHLTDSYEKLAADIINMIDSLKKSLDMLKQSKKLDNQKIQELITLSKDIKNYYNKFISEYNKTKRKLDNLYSLIEHQYNEPVRSELLKILIETKNKIDIIKQDVDHKYTREYLQNEDLKRILNRWLKKNIEDIIKKLNEDIENAKTDLEKFENDIKNLKISDIINGELEKKDIRNKMNEHKKKFDEGYGKAKIKLDKLYKYNPKSETYNQLKSTLDNLQREFTGIYRDYNELAKGLGELINFIHLIMEDLNELETISRAIEKQENVPENCGKFNNIYNRIMGDINSLSRQYSRNSLIYILLRKIEKHIESYQTKISNQCRQTQIWYRYWY